MMQRLVAIFLAMGILLFCAIQVSAQSVVTFSSGGLHRLSAEQLEQQLGNRLEQFSITLLPAAQTGVLYLDGKPVIAGTMLTRSQADRLMLFSTNKIPVITLGITVPQTQPTLKKIRIQCINRMI